MQRNFVYVVLETLNDIDRVIKEAEAEGLGYKVFNSDPGKYIIEIEYRPGSKFLGMLPLTCFKVETTYTLRQR